MAELSQRCVSDKELLERIVKIETATKVSAEERKEALILARELLDKKLELASTQITEKLEVHNQWQRRWDKNELVLASKKELDEKTIVLEEKMNIRIRNLERLFFIGVGLAIASQYFFGKIRF